MRPLKLIVQGFKPFKDKQEIDFSKLEFFVIKGPTGSGKSSILDAISYALFKETANGMKQQYQKEFINRNSTRMRVDFTFSVGGNIYRIERWWTKGKGGDFRFYENNARRVLGEAALRREIKRILGVDAEQFRKIFFLPQGRYAEFFYSKPAERREMLISLLDLRVYTELTEKLKERLSEVEKELANLEGKLAILAEVSAERIEELLKEKEKLTRRLEELRNRRKTLEEELKKTSLLLEKIKRRKHLEEEIKRLVGGEYLRLKEEVERLKPLKGLLPYLQKYLLLIGDLQNLKKEKEETVKELNNLETQIVSAEEVKQKLLKERESLESEIEKLEIYRKSLGLIEALEPVYRELAERKKYLQRLEEEIKHLEEKFEHLKRNAELLQAELETVERELEKNPYNPEKETEYRLTLQRCEERDRLLTELKLLEKKLSEALGLKEKLLKEIENIERNLSEVERQIEDYRSRERDYLVYLLVRDLKEGDPCPICGRPLEELKKHFQSDFDPKVLKTLERQREELISEKGELERLLAVKENEIENLQKRIEEIRKLLENLKNLPSTDDVLKTLKSLGEAKEQRQHLEEKRERLKALVEERRREISSLEGVINEKRQILLKGKKELEIQKERLREKLLKIIKILGKKPPKGVNTLQYLKRVLKETIENIESSKNRIETKLGETESLISNLRTLLEERKKLLGKLEERICALEGEVEKLAVQLKEGGIEPTGDLRGMAEKLEKLPSLENELEKREKEIAALRAELDSLERELQNIDYSSVEERYRDLERELKTLGEEEEKAITRLGALKENIENLRKKLKEKEETERLLEQLRHEHALLKTIREDFKSDKLIKFVVDQAMADLVELAGDYLYKLSDRYRFILEEGEIKVEDLFSASVRDIKTLSGGETFLASISFALALGGYLGKSASVESIFIDEGFGTLDKEKLERIGELFEKFRYSVDKGIGIITHLEELALRFDQRIEVIPSPEGSKVKVFY